MDSPEELLYLVRQSQTILEEELRSVGIDPKLGTARIYSNLVRIGVQGDGATLCHPIEIEVNCRRELDQELLSRMATRIPNEVEPIEGDGINTVLYVIAKGA